ncbi:MAG: ATP-binding cassette domain-containing protein [Pseudomonadota bacterium]
MFRLQTKLWVLALILGASTTLAGVLLVGVSSWFLASVALAGLGPAALLFNFHFPAAAVRLLALIRTGGKYAERITGHEAALQDQAVHREQLFRKMAASQKTRARGWQLARADELEAFLGDVEADDFEPLRFSFPVVTTSIVLAILFIVTAVSLPLALVLIVPLALASATGSWWAAQKAARSEENARNQRGTAGRDLGLALSGLVSLDARGDRDQVLSSIVGDARRAEHAASDARQGLGAAAAIASLFGPLAACAVILVAWTSGARGEGLLLPVFIAFSWLAIGEHVLPLARQIFAHRQAVEARGRLGSWTQDVGAVSSHQVTMPDTIVMPLTSPSGASLGPDLTLSLVCGRPMALLGPSGCGKTTALKRIAGWLPWQGPGDHPLGSETTARSMVHYSLHDAVILRGTVRANLFTNKADETLWHALKVVELEDRVREAGGLEAMVSQDGWSLGEARRLQLARALLSDKPFVLFDEPGEHLGDDQAARILKRCLQELTDRRVLFVTHQHVLANLASVQEVIG